MNQRQKKKLAQMQRAGHDFLVADSKVVSVPEEAEDFFTPSELAELIAEIETNR